MEVAKMITNLPEDQCKDFRKVAKTIVLGINYGRTEYSICEELRENGLSVSESFVNMLVDRYFQNFSGIWIWRNDRVDQALKSGSIRSILGRSRSVSSETKIKSLYNHPIQASATDGFKLALFFIDRELADQDARLVHIMHDEVIIEVKEEIANSVAIAVKKCMEDAFKRLIPNVPFKVEPIIRKTWGPKY